MKKGIFFVLIIVVIFILIFSGCGKSKKDKLDDRIADWLKKVIEDLTPTQSLFLIALVITCFNLASISKSLAEILTILKESELKQITNLLSDLRNHQQK